jgi:transposase InsO family protein
MGMSWARRTFKDFGLPRSIRTDNGNPFASANAIFGLSRLSVWWLRLGIGLERIQPGKPTQNGRHERMHLTLKKETTKPAANNFLQQQEKFDHFQSVDGVRWPERRREGGRRKSLADQLHALRPGVLRPREQPLRGYKTLPMCPERTGKEWSG